MTLKKNYLNSIGTDAVLAYDAEEQVNPTSTGKTSVRYYYHTNQIGSIIAISTSTGLIVQKYSYNAHGKPYVSIGNGLYALSSYTGTLYGNSRLYTGREFENDTGYYYMRARYHSSDLGRFISRDPIGQNDQVNLYTYVRNSPLNYTDRNGKKASAAIVSTWNYAKYVVGSIVEGGAKGDFIQNPNGWNTAGQIGAGVIPIYGQGADLRDAGAAWDNCSGGWDCAGSLGLAGVGFIPFVGDGLKALGKGIRHIDSSVVHFTQDTISQTFKNGERVEDLTKGLKNGVIDPSSIKPIRIFERNGEMFSLDNRRLKAFQDAGKDIPFMEASPDEVFSESWKFTTKNGGTSINFR